MRLVFVTQQVDPLDPNLGATVAKIRALARRVDEVAVLTGGAVPDVLPDTCRVHRFGARTKVGRGVRFERALAAALARRPRPAAVIAHMCPIYAVLAAPLAKPLRVPVVLWFTHWRRTRTLVAAERVSDRVLSVDARSVPLASAKVVGIGHGIDMEEFSCGDAPPARDGLVALAVGRYSAAKGLATTVRAVGIARGRGVDVRLDCHGTVGTEQEAADKRSLEALVAELGLGEAVRVGGPVPRPEVPAHLAAGDVLVNNMRAGAADKIVFEAAASCLPVLVSNPSFGPLVEGLDPRLRFEREDPDDLAGRLEQLARLDARARRALGRELRTRVEGMHSTESWAEAVVHVVRGLR